MKRNLAIAAAALLALAAAFGAGRFLTPTKVEIQTQVVEKVVTRDVIHEVVKEVEGKDTVQVVTRTITKEGAVTERIVTREVVKTVKEAATDATHDATADTTTKTDTVRLADAPRFSVALLAGVDFNPAWQPIPGAGPLALGLAINYRFAGPFTVGAFGLHTGVVGVSLGMTF